MPLKDEVRLARILDAITEIEQISQGLSQQVLAGDRVKQLALVKLIEIIGETANNLNGEFRSAMPDVNWVAVIAMRNRLVHSYFEIDYQIVWPTVQHDMPALKREILKYFHD
jgi:uncharacterized protein with HEPN domain